MAATAARAAPLALAIACSLAPPADAAPGDSLVALRYTTAYPSILAKADDWNDPRTAAESQALSPSLGEPVRPSRTAVLPLVAQAWDTVARARAAVRLPAGEVVDASARLVGESDVPELRLASSEPPRVEDGVALFEVAAPTSLPHRIAVFTGTVRWILRSRGRDEQLGRTIHTLLVTAGPPRPAASWPISGRGAPSPAPDHNAFTAFRLQAAVRITEGATSPNEAAARAWRLMKHHYDLSADADVNPWTLLGEGNAGQCMTTASFVEGVVDILGFEGGRVVYVYPSLRRPKDPSATAIPNPRIPGAFTVEAPTYDVRSQFRTVTGVASPGPGEHSVTLAERHRGGHGIERLKMRDPHGELHNYAAAFVLEEHGARSYYGGGYDVGPYHGAAAFLAGACTAVVWAYEDADSDDWDHPCDAPGAVLSWLTGTSLRR